MATAAIALGESGDGGDHDVTGRGRFKSAETAALREHGPEPGAWVEPLRLVAEPVVLDRSSRHQPEMPLQKGVALFADVDVFGMRPVPIRSLTATRAPYAGMFFGRPTLVEGL